MDSPRNSFENPQPGDIENVAFLESLYVHCLFAKNRQQTADLVPHLVMGLRSATPRVVEFCARTLAMFGQDSVDNLRVQGCCKAASEALERNNQAETLVALSSLIYWLSQDVDAKREIVELGSVDKLKDIQENISDVPLSKAVTFALGLLQSKVKTRGELQEQTRTSKILSTPKSPSARSLFPRTPIQTPSSAQRRSAPPPPPESLLLSPLSGFLPKPVFMPSLAQHIASVQREATPTRSVFSAIDQLLGEEEMKGDELRPASVMDSKPKVGSVLTFKDVDPEDPELATPPHPAVRGRARGASIKLSALSREGELDPETVVPVVLVMGAKELSSSENGPKPLLLEEPMSDTGSSSSSDRAVLLEEPAEPFDCERLVEAELPSAKTGEEASESTEVDAPEELVVDSSRLEMPEPISAAQPNQDEEANKPTIEQRQDELPSLSLSLRTSERTENPISVVITPYADDSTPKKEAENEQVSVEPVCDEPKVELQSENAEQAPIENSVASGSHQAAVVLKDFEPAPSQEQSVEGALSPTSLTVDNLSPSVPQQAINGDSEGPEPADSISSDATPVDVSQPKNSSVKVGHDGVAQPLQCEDSSAQDQPAQSTEHQEDEDPKVDAQTSDQNEHENVVHM